MKLISKNEILKLQRKADTFPKDFPVIGKSLVTAAESVEICCKLCKNPYGDPKDRPYINAENLLAKAKPAGDYADELAVSADKIKLLPFMFEFKCRKCGTKNNVTDINSESRGSHIRQ